ncbi:hypothetical protein LOK49_LG03G02571 [Camellia lanceoleosa]|uniref:Uncharacterized protein n=1 Tax=Camellia lanceoleosa TaxID=1840588 RepID=A0ACC0I6H6_9ERIC|nr:hypothetical protein LOK49_LG03G02571 [Camellia lanceoleosa]
MFYEDLNLDLPRTIVSVGSFFSNDWTQHNLLINLDNHLTPSFRALLLDMLKRINYLHSELKHAHGKICGENIYVIDGRAKFADVLWWKLLEIAQQRLGNVMLYFLKKWLRDLNALHIDSALSISRLMLEIGYNEAAPTRDMLHNAMKKITQVLEESPTRDMLRNAMKKITQVLEGQHSTEEHTPSENLVYTCHRNRGATS